MPELRLRDRILHATAGWHTTTDPACREYKPTKEGTRLDRNARGIECSVCLSARFVDQPVRSVVCPECDERIPIPVTVELEETEDGHNVIATPDLTDVWAHVWTHSDE